MNIDHETKVEGQNQNYYSALSVNAVSFATSIPYQTTESSLSRFFKSFLDNIQIIKAI